jgi:hypothetical protein
MKHDDKNAKSTISVGPVPIKTKRSISHHGLSVALPSRQNTEMTLDTVSIVNYILATS